MQSVRFALLLLVLTLLGCAGGPPRRVFPPELSLHEMRLDADGRWVAQLRIRSFSTVSMQLSQIDGKLGFADATPHDFNLRPQINIAAGSVELIDLVLQLSANERALIDGLAGGRGSLKYSLSGQLHSSDPKRDFEFEYSSALSPAPGLINVLR